MWNQLPLIAYHVKRNVPNLLESSNRDLLHPIKLAVYTRIMYVMTNEHPLSANCHLFYTKFNVL